MANSSVRGVVIAMLCLVAGCAAAPEDVGGSGDDGDSGGSGDNGGGGGGGGGGGAAAEVFANSESALYRFDPDTKTLVKVGAFDCVFHTPDPDDSLDGMTDIAADASGALYGIGAMMGGTHAIVKIDRTTAHCEQVTPHALTAVGGLTFIPAGVLDQTHETLVGVDVVGTLRRFDLGTGGVQSIGGSGWQGKSADLVAIDGDRTYSTSDGGTAGDHLLAVDPKTGAIVEDIGATGVPQIYGLGYWGGTVYGFTQAGKLFALSTSNAAATEIPLANPEPDLHFFGAAVTTSAPIVLL